MFIYMIVLFARNTDKKFIMGHLTRRGIFYLLSTDRLKFREFRSKTPFHRQFLGEVCFSIIVNEHLFNR